MHRRRFVTLGAVGLGAWVSGCLSATAEPTPTSICRLGIDNHYRDAVAIETRLSRDETAVFRRIDTVGAERYLDITGELPDGPGAFLLEMRIVGGEWTEMNTAEFAAEQVSAVGRIERDRDTASPMLSIWRSFAPAACEQ